MVDKLDRWIKQRFQSYNVIWKIQNVLIWKVDCDIMDEFFFAGLREFNGNNERWERARWVVSLTLSLCHVLSPGFRTFFSPCLILSSPSFSSKCFTIYHIFHAIVFPCIYFIIFSFSSSFLFFFYPISDTIWFQIQENFNYTRSASAIEFADCEKSKKCGSKVSRRMRPFIGSRINTSQLVENYYFLNNLNV